MDGELFFPNEQAHVNDRRIPRAKAVCSACPVWEDCLDWALENPRIAKGVYGGLLERERKILLRRRTLEAGYGLYQQPFSTRADYSA